MPKQILRRLAHSPSRLVPLAAPFALLCALALAALGTAPIAQAQPASDQNAILTLRTLDNPAIVRIITEVDAQMICHGCGSGGGDFTFPNDSANASAYQAIFSGSGSFVSADGYILTADHVVDQDCTSGNNEQAIVQLWEQDLQTNYQSYGFSSANDANQWAQNQLNGNTLTIQCTNNHYTKVFPSVAYTGQLQSAGGVVSFQMSQVVASSPTDKQDTAIIKIDVPHDMPYLTLAPASQISVGETATGLAFPGDADQSDFSVLLNPTGANADVNTLNSLLSPSTDTGQITNQQTLSDGTLVYETSGTGFHGSSGGPAVDDQGHIVGFYDYLNDTSSNRVISLISSTIAAKYMQQAGISKPAAGSVMGAWTKAVNDFYGAGPCHFGNAYNDLAQLKDQHPEFGGVESYYLQAQQKQTPKACQAYLHPGPSSGLMALLVVLLLVLAAGAGGFIFLRRKKPAQVPAAVPVGVSYSGFPTFATPAQSPLASASLSSMPGAVPMGPQSYPPQSYPPVGEPVANGGVPAFSNPPSPTMPTTSAAGLPTVAPVTPMPQSAPASYPGARVEMTPLSLPVAQPAAGLPAQSEQHVCINGHAVSDLLAHFCPECGAAVQQTQTNLL